MRTAPFAGRVSTISSGPEWFEMLASIPVAVPVPAKAADIRPASLSELPTPDGIVAFFWLILRTLTFLGFYMNHNK